MGIPTGQILQDTLPKGAKAGVAPFSKDQPAGTLLARLTRAQEGKGRLLRSYQYRCCFTIVLGQQYMLSLLVLWGGLPPQNPGEDLNGVNQSRNDYVIITSRLFTAHLIVFLPSFDLFALLLLIVSSFNSPWGQHGRIMIRLVQIVAPPLAMAASEVNPAALDRSVAPRTAFHAGLPQSKHNPG